MNSDIGNMINMAQRICTRTDSDVNLVNTNPVLLNGEIVFVLNYNGTYTGKYKVGDGKRHYRELDYNYSLVVDSEPKLCSSEDSYNTNPVLGREDNKLNMLLYNAYSRIIKLETRLTVLSIAIIASLVADLIVIINIL